MSLDVIVAPPRPAKPDEAAGPVLTGMEEAERARMLRRAGFGFRHSLGHSPLMSLDAVRGLTRHLLEQGRYEQVFFASNRLGEPPATASPSTRDAILAALAEYDRERAWLRLTRVDEISPEYGALIERFYDDLSACYGEDVRRGVVKTFATLFVSSPGAVTPYHIDHTWNFLLQIEGNKTVHLFDPDDPRVLTEEEKEAWYVQRGLIEAKPGAEGIAYDLVPGLGVHHPVNAPHWVQNGPDVSISLSLGLCLDAATRDAKVRQANYVLRKAGLRPLPPRRSGWRDGMKRAAVDLLADRRPNSFDDVLFSSVRRAKRLLKPLRAFR